MTKIDIISGFLGAGKTTLIKKLLQDAFKGQQVVLIENEFGEIGIDGGFLKDAGIEIKEMNSGCICCSLVGDFGTALKEVVEKYHPDIIVPEIEAIRTERLYHLEKEGIQVVPSARAVNFTMNRKAIRDLAAKELGLKTAKYFYAKSLDELKEAA